MSMSVLRVKRKIGEDRVPVLVAESESKRRRVWRLEDAAADADVKHSDTPPRFDVTKREVGEDDQVVLELRRVDAEGVKDTHMEMVDDYLAEWVYDTYYPVAATEAIAAAEDALRNNYGLLEHFDMEELVLEEEEEENDEHDSDDSNAESYAGNDYPDEDDFAYSSDGRSSFSDGDRSSFSDDYF